MGSIVIPFRSDKTISNLMQYGLLERVGKGEVKVSRLAVDILYPAPGDSNAKALADAAFRPQLFADLRSRFVQTPSREALKSYLKREGFLDRAINPIASAYLDTCAYIEQLGANEFDIPSDGEDEEFDPVQKQEPIPMHAQAEMPGRQPVYPPPPHSSDEEPIYTIKGGRISLGGAIVNKKQANEVINLINAVMAMLPDAKEDGEQQEQED